MDAHGGVHVESLRGQGWGACQSCHSDGLTDNVTWHFARGPRQSTGLDGSSSTQAADVENPLGLDPAPQLNDWSEVEKYMQSIRSPRGPSNLDPYQVAEGEKLFLGASCQGCHSGDKWTISQRFYTPGTEKNASLNTTAFEIPYGFPQEFEDHLKCGILEEGCLHLCRSGLRRLIASTPPRSARASSKAVPVSPRPMTINNGIKPTCRSAPHQRQSKRSRSGNA